MNNEYIIINKTALEKRMEELTKNNLVLTAIKDELLKIISQSTPLIPVLEQAFTKGERYGWDSQKSIGNIDEMKEKIKLQSLDNYILKLKLDI